MTLHIHRAERADSLVLGLAEMLADPLPDVFAEEVVAVPARGMERWLTQQLSHRLGRGPAGQTQQDGVCAGVRFPSPAALIGEILGAQAGDPWAPERLVWPLLEVIDEVSDQPWCAMLGAHLGSDTDSLARLERQGRRYAVARRLAGLFHRYAIYRPQLVEQWSQGRRTDGVGTELGADFGWQAQLWRLVAERIAGPDPAQRLQERLALLAKSPEEVELPERVSLFGLTRLPAAHCRVLATLAQSREVHLWLPHPSPVLWSRIAQSQAAGPVRRRSDPSAALTHHPLLTTLGRESRELQLTLAAAGKPYQDTHLAVVPPVDLTATLLGRLQSDLRHDQLPVATGLDGSDRTISVHACHGAARQVEVLRDLLVGLLADDPTLEPRDILVMCPDVETYAPLIAAGFGLADVADAPHPAHQLRVRLADRAPRQTNPLVGAALKLLGLADSRVTASQVADLVARPEVRRRFEFTDDDLATVADWVSESGVRWGLDAEHRCEFGLASIRVNTWQAGLDRILLGAAMAGQHSWLDSALPLEAVGSGQIELAGRLAELIDRLRMALDSLSGEQPVRQWLETLIAGVDSLASVAVTDGWQRVELRREFQAVIDEAGPLADSTTLRLPDIRALLTSRLAGRPSRANFRTGTLTVCTMVPMRSVPHRVVCLLGLDDGVFPRRTWVDGDDVLARDALVGERDPRSEDRQLMLDALMSATERVVITYTGADERTGARRPPAVPLGELIDVVRIMVGGDERSDESDVVTRHPLQPFDSRALTPGGLGVSGMPGSAVPFSFDPSALSGAQAAAGHRTAAPVFLSGPLPRVSAPVIELADLVGLLQDPARGFLRQRLDVAVPDEQVAPSDAIAVELDPLQRQQLGARLLRDRLSGADYQQCRQAEWRRGVLPPGRLGNQVLDEVMAEVEEIMSRTKGFRQTERRTVDFSTAVTGSRQLHGTVSGLRGDQLVWIEYTRLAAKHRLRAWIEMTALTVAYPDREWGAVSVGRGVEGLRRSIIRPLEVDAAREVLDQLIEVFDEGLRAPLPLPPKTSAAYAGSRKAGRNAQEATRLAGRVWAEEFGEATEPAYAQVWGAAAEFDVLLADSAGLDDTDPGDTALDDTEPHRFGVLATRVWSPLLDREVVTTL